MSYRTSKAVLAAAALAAAGIAGTAFANGQDDKSEQMEKAEAAHAPAHKISRAQAQAIALRAVPGGRVVEYDFEKEGGIWRHSFDIRQGKVIREIGIDANSGKIVENAIESADDKD